MKVQLRQSAAHVFVDDLSKPHLSDDDRHHLLRVLRVGLREDISVCDGRGSWSLATIGQDGELQLKGECLTEMQHSPVLTVAFAPTKGDRPDDVVRKLTEIGIDRIVPIVGTKRGVVRWEGAKAEKHSIRLARIAREAAMQSRRLWLPEITEPCALVNVVTLYAAALAEPGGAQIEPTHTCIAIGPEGGFSADELELSQQHVSLGDGVLRGETAAIVAGALMAAQRWENS